MKKMTKEEFLNSKIGDFFYLYECKFSIEIGIKRDSGVIDRNKNLHLNINNLNVQIIEEKPPITQYNLSKFYLKFKECPESFFWYNKNDKLWIGRLLDFFSLSEDKFYSDFDLFFPYCEITDERWTEENLR